MTAVVSVRAVRLDDAEAVAELCGQLGYPSGPDDVRSRLADLVGRSDHAVFVAEVGASDVIGWVHVFLSPLVERDLQAEIGGLVTLEGHRGKGVGRLLMQQAEAWTKLHGGQAVCLRSNVVRQEAHEFYRHLGYRPVKTSLTFRKSFDIAPPAP